MSEARIIGHKMKGYQIGFDYGEFIDCELAFKKRATEILPGLDQISDILIGLVKGTEGDNVYITLWGKNKDRTEIVKTDRVFKKGYSTIYGNIEEGLPIAFIVYKSKHNSKYNHAIVPGSINSPRTWIPLRSNFNYSKFKHR